MFSDTFSEGQTRDINEGFPPDSHPCTEEYDYLSDSDLEDGSSWSDEEDEELSEADCDPQQMYRDASDQGTSQNVIPGNTLSRPSSVGTSEAQNNDG